MPKLQEIYSDALENFAGNGSSIQRTRARGLLEQLTPLITQEMKDRNRLAEIELSGRYGLKERGLANEGSINVQTLSNKGRIADRKLANLGALEQRSLINKGNLDVQTTADKASMRRVMAKNDTDVLRSTMKNNTESRLQQLEIEARRKENEAARKAALLAPVYKKVGEVADPLDPTSSRIVYGNINLYPERLKSYNAGSIDDTQLGYLRK